jgi:hypothetical protein
MTLSLIVGRVEVLATSDNCSAHVRKTRCM